MWDRLVVTDSGSVATIPSIDGDVHTLLSSFVLPLFLALHLVPDGELSLVPSRTKIPD